MDADPPGDSTKTVPGDLRARLKAETAGIHQRLDALPFFQALHAGTLPQVAIVSFLRSVAVIHAVVEHELSAVSNQQVAELGQLATPKVPLLVADLEVLQAETLPSIGPALQAALGCGAEILAHADHPLSLIGALYVLEGSHNGGVVLKQAYARCLGVGQEQLSYFGCYGNATAAHWNAFTTQMNALVLTSEEVEQITQAAVRCFERIETICAALYPYSGDSLKHHVAAINFEAGDHAMPQDPREVALALRTGRAAWKKYPYLEQRFGDRGRRFTSSDSCWLVAQARMTTETASKNLEWLRTVLASRGIPTVILERHLRAIAQALAAEFPEQADLPSRFDRFLSAREAERRSIAGGDAVLRLVEQFDRRLGACAGPTVDSAAQLIASAWLDERTGVPGALAATRDWFTDAARFSADWIASVNALVAGLDRAAGSPC